MRGISPASTSQQRPLRAERERNKRRKNKNVKAGDIDKKEKGVEMKCVWRKDRRLDR